MNIQEAKNTLISILNGVKNANLYFSGLVNKSEFVKEKKMAVL
jgi:hypothetical protein